MSLFIFDYSFDKERLIDEAIDFDEYTPFVDPKNGNILDYWLIKNISSGYAKQISDDFANFFSVKIKPRFYYQKAGYSLPFHKDRGTMCSINFVLSEERDMISFKDYDIFYNIAVLDTQVEHAVLNPKADRLLFKLSITDLNFDDVVNILKQSLNEFETLTLNN
jgi:hypothetical protein